MPSVLITGASKGIGRATAAEFASRGYRVIATARDPRTLEDLDVAQRLRLDVTDQATVDEAIAAAGQVDVLVSNAGVIFLAAVEASPVTEIERLFAQNTAGAMRVAQAVLPQMRERRTDGCCSSPARWAASSCRARPPTPPASGHWRPWSSRWPSRPSRSGSTRACLSPGW